LRGGADARSPGILRSRAGEPVLGGGRVTCFIFFAGFLFLAMICFCLDRKEFSKLPWFLLGSFALVQGLNEWAGRLIVTYGLSGDFLKVLPFFRLFLIFSFLSLLSSVT